MIVDGRVKSYATKWDQRMCWDKARVEVRLPEGLGRVEVANRYPDLEPPYDVRVTLEGGWVVDYAPRAVETFSVDAEAAFRAWDCLSPEQLGALGACILVDLDDQGRLFNLRVAPNDDAKAQAE